ncbi:MAG: prefoldin subunit [Nanoarchaeota archaeon]|nr:prefoldin subunit [Nanoarchaeota archaeon]
MDNSDINKKVEELQFLEQQLQGFLMQKQTVQIEVNEINNALVELKSSEEEVYKIVSGFMMKSTKEKLSSELEEKKKLLDSRIESLDKQGALLEKNATEIKKEIDESISNKK